MPAAAWNPDRHQASEAHPNEVRTTVAQELSLAISYRSAARDGFAIPRQASEANDYEEAVWEAFEKTDTLESIAARIERDKIRDDDELGDPALMGCLANAKRNRGAQPNRRPRITPESRLIADQIDEAQMKAMLLRRERQEQCSSACATIRAAVEGKRTKQTIETSIKGAFRTITGAMLVDRDGIPSYLDFLRSAHGWAARYSSALENERFLIALSIGFAHSGERDVAKQLLMDMDARLDLTTTTTPHIHRVQALALIVLAAINSAAGEEDLQIITARKAWRVMPKDDRALSCFVLRRYRAILTGQGKPSERIRSAVAMEELYADTPPLDDFLEWLEEMLNSPRE